MSRAPLKVFIIHNRNNTPCRSDITHKSSRITLARMQVMNQLQLSLLLPSTMMKANENNNHLLQPLQPGTVPPPPPIFFIQVGVVNANHGTIKGSMDGSIIKIHAGVDWSWQRGNPRNAKQSQFDVYRGNKLYDVTKSPNKSTIALCMACNAFL